MKAVSLFAVVAAAACSQSNTLPEARFANANPVRVVDDRRNVPTAPALRKYLNVLYQFNGSFRRPIERAFSLDPPKRAQGINALDEVPDSTWFTNRIGVRALTPDEIRRGPCTIDNPGDHLPWTVISSKAEGDTLGLFVEDARGERFLIKFDAKGFPEAETGAEVITNRLLWAVGYNVPEDFVTYITRGDLHVSPKATYKDRAGRAQKLQQPDIDAKLVGVDVGADGRLRVTASRILPGKPLGGHPDEGVRADDPNDIIPHQLRRDLRGTRAIYAWLDHVDIKESNSLDVWVEDRDNQAKRYVMHYWLDFGSSLGVLALTKFDQTRAYDYYIDYPQMLQSLVTLGMSPRDWDRRDMDKSLRGVGLFNSRFDPSLWTPSTPAYLPLVVADRIDWLWGAKLVMRFTPEQLRAAVDAGQLSDPRSVDYLVYALRARQHAVGAYAFEQASPLDFFSIGTGSSLCFDDLATVYGFSTRSKPSWPYTVTTYDRRGRRVAPTLMASPQAASGRVCTSPLPLVRGGDQYTIWRITTNGSENGVLVHVARNPVTATLRVIGVWRE